MRPQPQALALFLSVLVSTPGVGAAQGPIAEASAMAAAWTPTGPLMVPSYDLGGILARMGAGSARDRGEAEQEFRRALGPGATPPSAGDLATKLSAVSPEVRRRVSIALGDSPAGLGLAVELALLGPGEAEAVGRAAIDAQILRWSASAMDEPEVAVFDLPRQAIQLPERWQDAASFQVAVDPNDGGPLLAFERFDRLGGGPTPVVLDPALAERLVRRPGARITVSRLSGSWTEVLEALSVVNDAAFQVQGYRHPDEIRASDTVGGVARPWIHVVPGGTTEIGPVGRDVRRTGAEVIAGWCLDAARGGNGVRQRAAARALASLDWPAPVRWFEARWLAIGDVAALEGLMAAAARGRVAPSLQRPEVIRRILELVDEDDRGIAERSARLAGNVELDEVLRASAEAKLAEDVAAAEARARRVAAGLAGLAPIALITQRGAGAPPLAPVLVEGFGEATPIGRWVRLVALEGLGVTDPAAAALARSVVLGSLDARSRRQGLRTYLACSPPEAGAPLRLTDPMAMLLVDPPRVEAVPGQPDQPREPVDPRVDQGIGLELGLAGVGVAAGSNAWIAPLARDRNGLAELLVWAGLLLRADPETEIPWAEAVVRAAVAEARDTRPYLGPGPFERVANMARGGEIVEALRALAVGTRGRLGAADALTLDRSLVRVGVASAATRRAVMEGAQRALAETPDVPAAVEGAWLDLGALAGDQDVGESALAALQASLVDALELGGAGPSGGTEALVGAAEAAVRSMEGARLDERSEDFQNVLRRTAGRANHPLAGRFYGLDWPGRRPLPPRDVERMAAPLSPRAPRK